MKTFSPGHFPKIRQVFFWPTVYIDHLFPICSLYKINSSPFPLSSLSTVWESSVLDLWLSFRYASDNLEKTWWKPCGTQFYKQQAALYRLVRNQAF